MGVGSVMMGVFGSPLPLVFFCVYGPTLLVRGGADGVSLGIMFGRFVRWRCDAFPLARTPLGLITLLPAPCAAKIRIV